MGFGRRNRVITGSPVSTAFVLPADAILLTVRRGGTTGSVRIFTGILMAEGEMTNVNNISLWSLATKQEVQAIVVDSAMKHKDGSSMSVGIGLDGDIADGAQYYLRKTTAPAQPRISHTTRPRTPASFLVAARARQCEALPAPYKLMNPDEMIPSQRDRFDAYKTWQIRDDMYYTALYGNGVISGRFAQYSRIHTLCGAFLMSEDIQFLKYALTIMDSGSTPTQKWLDSLSTRIAPYTGTGADTLGNIGAVGSEPNLDMIDTMLPYLLTLCDDYLLALEAGASWLHNAARLGVRYGGVDYSHSAGWERLSGRAIHGNQLMVRANMTRTVAVLQGGDEVGGNVISPANLSAHMNRFLSRITVATGHSFDTNLRERGTIARSADTLKIQYGPVDQRDIVANGSVNITIPQQDVTIPAGATMTDDGTRRAINVRFEWNGTNVIAVAGTMRTGEPALNAAAQPWRGGNDANMPAVTPGNRDVGHCVIFAEPGTNYIANVTALPADSAQVGSNITTGGITCWMFCDTRNWGQKSYMAGTACNAVIDFIETFPSDPNVANLTTAITNYCDWLWNNCWLSAGSSLHFAYISIESLRSGYGNNQSGGGRTPNVQWRCLNGLLTLPFAWLAYKLNSTTWRDRYDTIEAAANLEELGTSAGWSSPDRPGSDATVNHMSGDQSYAYRWAAMRYRAKFGT